MYDFKNILFFFFISPNIIEFKYFHATSLAITQIACLYGFPSICPSVFFVFIKLNLSCTEVHSCLAVILFLICGI